MKTFTKALLAGLLTLAAVQGASAQVRYDSDGGYAQPYYPQGVQVQSQYAIQPGYYQDQDGWRARREWRERQEREARRAQWERRQEWRDQQDWRRQQEWRRHEEWAREHGRAWPYN